MTEYSIEKETGGSVVRLKYRPHDRQKLFHASTAKFLLFCTGVGGGKTRAGAMQLIKEALKSGAGAEFAVVAPTYRMLTQVVMEALKECIPREMIRDYNKTEQILYLINGVRILGVAGDREDTIDRMRGLNLAGAWGDEISQCPERLHQILVARLRDARGSMRIIYTTTPKGFNWLYRIFAEKKTEDGKPLPNLENYEIVTGSTYDNPYTPQEYKSDLEGYYVGVFKKQELYGEFVGYEGLVYPEFSRNIHVIDTKGIQFKEIIGCVDFGFTNPSAIAVIGLDSDRRAYVIREFYEKKVTDLAGWAKANLPEVTRYYADSANPAEIARFRALNMDCVGVEKKAGEKSEPEKSFVMSGIKLVSARLAVQGDGKPRLFVDKSCANTIMEFENYRYEEAKEGKAPQELPIKNFDHILDALRYAIISIDRREPVVLVTDW